MYCFKIIVPRRFKSCFPHSETLDFQGFLSFFNPLYPHSTPTSFSVRFFKRFYESLHTVSTFFSHRLRDVRIPVKRKRCGVVSCILLNCFHIVSCSEGINYISMPLWYNRKKRRSSYFTRGCAVCRCEISPFPALKWQRKICPGKEVCYANTKKHAKTGTKWSPK